MSAFESDELIIWQCVCSLRWDRCTWISNFKWPGLWNKVFFHNFRNTESSNKFRQRKLNTHMKRRNWFYLMIYAIHYKRCFLSVLYALSLSTCFPNMHVSPRYYTLPLTVLCVTWLVCVCLNGAHTRARIHSFFLTLTRGKTMSSHDQKLINPKSYGLVHNVCVKKICVCCMVFANGLI